MNFIESKDVQYLRSSRTIETILIANGNKQQVVYIYNYEGNHFRVFDQKVEIELFFNGEFEPEISFEDEYELDKYLENLEL